MLVGQTLRRQISRLIIAEVAQLPVTLLTEQEVALGTQQDIAASLVEQHCQPEEAQGVEDRPRKLARRDAQSIRGGMDDKTKQAIYALENRLAIRRVQKTITDAAELIQDLTKTSERAPLEELLVSRVTLMRHITFLDGAVDRLSSDRLFQQREEGVFAGVALATDESPPSQPRFRGLRFQIT
eukprot:7356593-Pyramimonas_sp.AAC.1